MVLVVKNPPANEGDVRDMGFILGLGRSPGGEQGNPLQYSYLENPMDRGSRQSIGSTTDWLATWHTPTPLTIIPNNLLTELFLPIPTTLSTMDLEVVVSKSWGCYQPFGVSLPLSQERDYCLGWLILILKRNWFAATQWRQGVRERMLKLELQCFGHLMLRADS